MICDKLLKGNKRLTSVALLVGIVLLLGFTFRFWSAKFNDIFLTRHQEIDARSLFVGKGVDLNGEHTFASPLAREGMIVRRISPRTPGIIRFNFKETFSFDSFSLYFYGDMHSVSSTLAEDFWVYYLDKTGKWNFVDEVRKNTSSVYRFRSPKTVSADAVEIIISKAAFADTVHYGDVRFFRKQRANIFQGVKFLIQDQQRSLVARLVYYFVFLTLLILPGFVLIDLIARKRKLDLDSDFKLIFSPVFSIGFWFLAASFYYFTGSKILLNFYWPIFFYCLVILFRRRNYFLGELLKSKILLLMMVLALLIVFLVIAERDYLYNLPYIYRYLDSLKPIPMTGYYGYEADNLFQWGIARMFLHRLLPWSMGAKELLLDGKAMTVFDRTPVLPMTVSAILSFFGESHFVYQRFLETLVVLYYGGMYLVMKTIFSKKVAKIVLLLVLLNVPLSFMAFNAELFYKYFALYPILLALALLFKQRKPNGALMAGLLGLAFLIHPMTLIFSAIIIFLFPFRYRFSRKTVGNVGLIIVVLGALISGWFCIFRVAESFVGVESQNLYWGGITNLDRELIVNKLLNFLNFFVPNIFLENMVGGVTVFSFSKLSLSFLRFSLISNLTPVFFVLLLIYVIKNGRRDYQVFILGLGPLLAFLIFYLHQHDFQGQQILIYPFIVPFLLGYITNCLIKMARELRIAIFGSYIAFMFINFYFISGVFIKINCVSPTVWWLFRAIIFVFVFLSAWLLKICLSSFNGARGDNPK